MLSSATAPAGLTGGSALDDEMLSAMRHTGDDPADQAIGLWEKDGRSVRRLADLLVGFDHASQIDELIELLSASNAPLAMAVNPALRITECSCYPGDVNLGEELFRRHGLKMLMILVFYSLPAAYAAHRGARVLHSNNGGTGFMVKDVNRRLIETTQFVIEVLTPAELNIAPSGGTGAHGRAVRSALRVRLLHASVRALIGAHAKPQWDAKAFGTPINQEDMAGTFLSFSWIVIDGMRKLHLGVSPREEQAFYEIWKKVALLLGLDPTLIPPTVADAEALTNLIRRRQVDDPILAGERNEAGEKMTAVLLDFLQQAMPPPLRWVRRLPASVMRFFLPRHPADVATSLGVPRTYVLDELVRLWFFIESRITKFAIFDTVNRVVFQEWGRRDKRAHALFQASRFFMKRLVVAIQQFDRNAPLEEKHRTPHIDLLEWDRRWQFDQADFITRGVRQAKARVASR